MCWDMFVCKYVCVGVGSSLCVYTSVVCYLRCVVMSSVRGCNLTCVVMSSGL